MPADRHPSTPPRLLTIAGSDSGAGAGIQADLKTFAAFSTYGMSVITAITAQNTLGVQAVEGVSSKIVQQQLNSVVVDIGVDAIKTGMLYSEETILAIVDTFERLYTLEAHPPIIVDPVLVSTSGHSLLPMSAVDSMRTKLLPWANMITPNIPEAELITNRASPITTVEDMKDCARVLGALGVRWIYLKGGHMPLDKEGGKVVVDLLWDSAEEVEMLYERPFLSSANTHGTGCTLSSAIAAGIANGHSIPEAVRKGADFVASAISASYPLGGGHGPVNHFFASHPRALVLPSETNPRPFTDFLINYNRTTWNRYVKHPFPLSLCEGTAKIESFLAFITQDYHFLKQYARTNALAAYKTESMEEMAASMVIVDAVVRETEMHIKYCEKWAISREELINTPESLSNIAYTRYVLDVSNKGDLLDLRVVTAPCLIGYGVVGVELGARGEKLDQSNNPYWGWIQEYGGEAYQGAVKTGIDLLEASLARSPISPARLEELGKIFVQATELEIAFWDAAVAAK